MTKVIFILQYSTHAGREPNPDHLHRRRAPYHRAIRTAYYNFSEKYMSSPRYLSYMAMENGTSSPYFLNDDIYLPCYLKTQTEEYRRYTRNVCIYYPTQPPHISHIHSVISASKSFLSMQEKEWRETETLLLEFPFWLSGSGSISERHLMPS